MFVGFWLMMVYGQLVGTVASGDTGKTRADEDDTVAVARVFASSRLVFSCCFSVSDLTSDFVFDGFGSIESMISSMVVAKRKSNSVSILVEMEFFEEE